MVHKFNSKFYSCVFIVAFSDDIDSNTVTGDSVVVEIDPVTGEDDSGAVAIPASGVVDATLQVIGSDLYITVASGIIQQNNIITVTIDDSVSSTGGTALTSDYEFYFTSQYYPLYSSWRRVMLDYGAYLIDIAKDTINLAIYEASLTADHLSFASGTALPTGISDYYAWAKREFVTCKAAEVVLANALASSNQNLKMKKLGDLEVQYDTTSLEQGLDKALGCLGKWEATIKGKGLSRRKPQAVVKGDRSSDLPPIGRTWTAPDRGFPIAKGKKLIGRRWYSGYYSPINKGRTGKGNQG